MRINPCIEFIKMEEQNKININPRVIKQGITIHSVLIIFQIMKISQIIFLFLLGCLCQTQQPICYVSCSQGGCSANNSQICTKCDTGTILLNNRCTSSGSQSQPIRILSPNAANALDTSGLPVVFEKGNQVKCRASSGQPNEITYLNVTISTQQIYTVRLPQKMINSPHQYINLKFNAILFNQQNNPNSQLRVLIVDGQTDKIIYDNSSIVPNEKEMACGQGTINFNKAFFVNLNISSSSQSLLISIITITPGDQLGLADINIYYGNCFMGCASCGGPGSNQCLSCQNLLIYDPNTKACSSCPKKFYRVNEVCLECPYNCNTCQFSQKEGGPICLSCESDITEKNVTPACQINNYVNESLKQLMFQNDNGWKSSATANNITTLCGSYSLVGGLEGFGGFGIAKTFSNLPVHKKIWIKFTFFLIDQVPGSNYRYYVTVDGVPAQQNSAIYLDPTLMNTNECGLQKKQFVTTVFINSISHTSDNATISIMGQSNYFGIRDFVLGVVNVTDITNCDQIGPNNSCIRCQNGYQLTTPDKPDQKCTVCPNGTYLSKGYCVICPIYCSTCLNIGPNSTRCSACDPPLIFDVASGTCNDKNSNLYTAALSQNWNKSVTSRQWNFSPKLQNKGIQKCGPYSILGSTTIQYRTLTMSRVFQNLPTHQGVYLHFFLYRIDNYDATKIENLRFKLDDREVPYNQQKNGYEICGNSSYDSIQKVTLYDPTHSAQNLTFVISGNNSKFGISNLLVFLTNCEECKNYGISYELETIPLYSAASNPDPSEKGLKSKIIFNQKVYINGKQKDLFNVKLIDKNSTEYQSLKSYLLSQNANNTFDERNPNGFFGRGQKDPFAITDSQFYANRQLILYQNLITDQYDKDAVAVLQSPDSAYGYKNNNENLIQSLRLQPVLGQFSRYDDIYSVIDTQSESGQRYRANTRNLMNLFRGISILALFIGLVSFFFNISEIFDDLFLLCQLIFVHIFIQSPWISATMKLPVGAMNLVQFMAWLPSEGRKSLESAIIPQNHYQRSPIVYEQYWRDITFARTIYHTIIFLAAMLIFFWLVRLIKSIREPSISKVMDVTHKKYHFVENYFYNHGNRWFVFIDKVMRFTFFTVMWASCLQFIHFYNQPNGFFGWNSALCIVMFVIYVAYIFLGYFYLRHQATISQTTTFRQKLSGVRIKREKLLYFIFRYLKLLAIAFIIGQLYNVNPLAVLIPLIFIHLLDAAILIFLRPYLEDLKEEDHHIVSRCAQNYWTFYRISHIIENLLFVILQIIMIIMFALREKANKYNYLQIGYACCAFIILMFINALVRLIWGFIRNFEICYDQVIGRKLQVQSQEEIGPLQYLNLLRANNNNNADVFNQVETARQLNDRRRPSIDTKI